MTSWAGTQALGLRPKKNTVRILEKARLRVLNRSSTGRDMGESGGGQEPRKHRRGHFCFVVCRKEHRMGGLGCIPAKWVV